MVSVKPKRNIPMQEETKRIIRKAVRNILDNTDLSDYKVRQIIKGELEDPCSWRHPLASDNDPDPDWAIKNYYLSLYRSNVFANWCDHIHARYGIAYSAHLVR